MSCTLQVISINIGIFQSDSTPALDGGKRAQYYWRLFRRKPLKQEIEAYVTLVELSARSF